MEEKTLNEKESLELISQMIQQTKKDSVIGSGDMFLMWGYLCVVASLSVYLITFIRQESHWGWLYIAIPVVGFIAAGIMGRRMGKRGKAPKTYTVQSINSFWACLSAIFAAYAVFCLMHWEEPRGWTGMFLLGLLLPSIGTYATGLLLKENALQVCGIIGAMTGIGFLHNMCTGNMMITMKWPLLMALSMVFTLVIPGHILNYKARKARKGKEA